MTGRPLRIGYLVQDFAPEVGAGPARVLEMARQWKSAGAEVTIVTGMPNRPQGRIHEGYRGRGFMEEEWEGHRVLRSWLYASERRGFLRTIANNVSFMATSAMHGAARLRGLDILIASSPPFFVHLSGEALRMTRRLPLVLEIRDLWPDYLVEMGVVRNRLAQRALFATERHLLRRARSVVVVTESFRNRIVEKGIPRERVEVIPNGVDTSFYFHDRESEPPLPSLRRSEGEFIVGYLGNFGAGQELRTVLDAAVHLADVPGIRLVLAGDGTERHRVVEHWRSLGLTNVTIEESIPKESTRAFYSHCDVSLVPLAPLPIFQETVPSKIFEVMACEVPVLASLSGEGAEIVERSGGGIATPPGDARAMADGILALRARTPEERRRLGAAGRDFVSRHYSRQTLASRYLDILREVVDRDRAPAAR